MVQVGRRMARLCDQKRTGVKTRVSTLALQLMTSASPGPASRARFCLWPEGWPGSGHGLGQGASWPRRKALDWEGEGAGWSPTRPSHLHVLFAQQ